MPSGMLEMSTSDAEALRSRLSRVIVSRFGLTADSGGGVVDVVAAACVVADCAVEAYRRLDSGKTTAGIDVVHGCEVRSIEGLMCDAHRR